MSSKAIIIGSGIAGLASALRLRKKGYEVRVFEANDYVGGKLTEVGRNGYRWDAGPSLFTMPQFVDELFELYGLNPRDHFNYVQKENVCNYFWEDGSRFQVSAETDKFISEAASYFEVPEKRLKKYLESSKRKYDLTAHLFLEKSLHKWSTYLSVETISSMAQSYKLDITQTLDGVNRKYFKNPKLVQLFNRYATYNGSSPYKTPGIMSIIPHLEMHFGTYLPKGGMHAITQSLYKLATEQGIKFHMQEPVELIQHKNGKVNGVKTRTGIYEADLVVTNMDIFSTYQHLLKGVAKPERILKQERSSSALIFYWGIRKEFKELDLHNIFFSENYQKEFDHIFNRKTVYDDPTVYINITSKEEKGDAPEGCENWFVMINTPGNFGQDWESIKKTARANILAKLQRILGENIEDLIEVEEILEPITIESKTSSHRGSLYGASSNSRFSAFLRHANFSNQLKQLYFCGGSVHPGGGIPLCLLSAKIVSDLVPDA